MGKKSNRRNNNKRSKISAHTQSSRRRRKSQREVEKWGILTAKILEKHIVKSRIKMITMTSENMPNFCTSYSGTNGLDCIITE